MDVCPLCNERINGDPLYIQHHINSCLDSSAAASSTGATLTPSGSRSSSTTLLTNGNGTSAEQNGDELLARKVENEIDQEALASTSAQGRAPGADARDSRSPSLDALDRSEPGCPICGATWTELGLSDANETMRTTHAEACLVGGGVGEEEEDWEERVRDGDAFQNGGREEAERGKIVLGKGSSKDRVYGTPALIPPLSQLLTRSHKDGRTTAAFLCCRDVEHVGTKLGDFGWGCGYRNAQMIYSSLLHMPCYAHLPSSSDSGGLPAIPTIPEFQSIIEMAWKCGYDPPGAAHFKGRLRGSRKWIGTTEVYVALTFLGIRTKIFDFPKNKKGDQGTNEVLVKWILNYFSTPNLSSPSSSSSASPPPPKKRPSISISSSDDDDDTACGNAFSALMSSHGSPVSMIGKQPLYLQHDGHSRTVVGVDRGKNGDWLLIFDPSKSPNKHLVEASSALLQSHSKRLKTSPPPFFTPAHSSHSHSNPKHAAFWDAAPGFNQIWTGKGSRPGFGRGSGGKEEKGALEVEKHSKLLEPYRVSLKSLSRNREYQVLYVEEGPLTESEKRSRKVIHSTRCT